jgi:hypothetical protein
MNVPTGIGPDSTGLPPSLTASGRSTGLARDKPAGPDWALLGINPYHASAAKLRTSYQIAVLSMLPEVAAADHAGASLKTRRESAAGAAARVDKHTDRSATVTEFASGTCLYLFVGTAMVMVAWHTNGPPQWRWSWLWALIAPAVGFFWVCGAVAVAMIALGFLKLPPLSSIAGVQRTDANGPTPDSTWVRLMTRVVLCVVMLALLAWSGSAIWRSWHGGISTVVWAIIWLVAAISASAVVYAAAEYVADYLRPVDVRDELVVRLGDALCFARFGAVLRDAPEKNAQWPPDQFPSLLEVLEAAEGVPTAADQPSERAEPSTFAVLNWPAARDAIWRSDRSQRRKLVEHISDVGSTADRYSARIVSSRETAVRQQLAAWGACVRAGMERLAYTTALGAADADDQLVANLAARYAAACSSHWDQLADTDPTPSKRRLVVEAVRRVAIAGAFVAAAFVFAPLAPDTQTQTQIRGALIAAAVLALTAPRAAFGDVLDTARKVILRRHNL